MSNERYPRGTAYHEAGHAVVAWALGLEVAAIWVSDDDARGGTDPADPDQVERLSLVEQIAVRYGGIAAEEVFGQPIQEMSGSGDREQVMYLLRAYCISEENGDAGGLRYQGFERARVLLEKHRTKVVAVAEHLVRHGRMEKDEFRRLLHPGRCGAKPRCTSSTIDVGITTGAISTTGSASI
jgi:ATP-dependent Zn protease